MFGWFGPKTKTSQELVEIATGGEVGLWQWYPEQGYFWLSDYGRKLLHLDAGPATLMALQRRVYEEDQTKFLQAFTNFSPDAPLDLNCRFQIRPDYYRWLRWRGQGRGTADKVMYAGSLLDIHEEYLIQTELQFTQDMLTEAQRIARIGSWQYDIPRDHLFWGEETFHIFGRDTSLGAPQGETQYRYFNREDLENLREKMQHAMQSGHPYQADLRAFRDDGHQITVRMMGRPMFDHVGNPYLVTGTVQDITDWVNLDRAREKAEQHQTVQNQFLASVSHEIRTPMNAIFGMAQLLQRSHLPPQQLEQVKVILTAARDLLTIINDLLDLAKVEAGQMTLETIPFDLQETVHEVTALHGSKIYAKNLEFIVDIASHVPAQVEGDPLRLKQVIGNLLSNAAKFTKSGHIMLQITTEGQVGSQQILRFAVTDTGVGIPPHRLSAVFEKYVQASAATAREYGGTGLGLSICRELVELMGGEIHVTSDGQHGSRFWFDVPLHVNDSSLPALLPSRLCVLEPSAMAARNLEKQLHGLNAEVTLLTSPDALLPALTNAAAHGGFTHLILSDSDGYDVNQIAMGAHAQLAGTATKIVLLARPMAMTDISDCFTATILKPVTPGELHRVLSQSHQSTNIAAGDAIPVLLVEDNAASQNAVAAALRQIGCDVTTANHGQEAIRQAKQKSFALIFMDIQMPVMDGLTATTELLRYWGDAALPPIPIVGLTGNVESQDRMQCLAAGMQHVLSKPVMLEDLTAVLQQFARRPA